MMGVSDDASPQEYNQKSFSCDGLYFVFLRHAGVCT